MARKTSQESESREVMDVDWDTVAEPLDVSLEKHGNKKPDRKVKVRGILRDAWLEKEAGLEAGRSRGRVFRVG